MSVTAVGSLALDTLVLPCGEYKDILGGSLSHFCTACSLFQTDLSMVAVVGEDFPREHLEYFSKRGINLEHLEIASGKTFRWTGQYLEGRMEDAITLDTQLNVFESFNPRFKGDRHKTKILFLGNIHPTLQCRIAEKTEAEWKILDTMNLWIDTTREELLKALRMVDILIFNEGEAKALTGETDVVLAGKKILELGLKYVVIKKGAAGACLISATSQFEVPAHKVEVVKDPTGAGDSFAGGFIGYLAEQHEINEDAIRNAMSYGNALGSMNVEGIGTSVLANSSRDQITERLNKVLGALQALCVE